MGTADELALDVLINALCTLSREQLGIRQLLFGGQNDDWPTPQVGFGGRQARPGAGDRRGARAGLPAAPAPSVRRLKRCACWRPLQREEFIPQVTMDPMRVGFGPGFAQAGEEGEEEDEDEEDDDAEFEGLGDFLP